MNRHDVRLARLLYRLLCAGLLTGAVATIILSAAPCWALCACWPGCCMYEAA